MTCRLSVHAENVCHGEALQREREVPTKYVHEDGWLPADEFGGGEWAGDCTGTWLWGATMSVGGEYGGWRLGAGVGGERSGLVVKTC